MGRKLKTYTIRGLVRTQNAILSILCTIKTILKHLEWIFIMVCLIGVWHYFCVFYPRFITIDEHNTYYKNLGIDYWGIIVGFLALLVTLLVGWNIYSTIKAKDDLKDYRKSLRDEVDTTKQQLKQQYSASFDGITERLSKIEKCCVDRGGEIAAVNSKISTEISRVKADLLFANGLYALEKGAKAKQPFERRIYAEAFKYFLDSLYIRFQICVDISEFRTICDRLNECLDGLEDDNVKFGEVTYSECIKNLNKILSEFELTKRQKLKIEALKARTEDISYTTFEEAIYNYAISVISQTTKPPKEGDDDITPQPSE